MTPQEQPKKPLSEASRRGKGFSQKPLQVDRVVDPCDPHPIYEGLFLWANTTRDGQYWATEDRWLDKGIATPLVINAKRRKARLYNLNKLPHDPRVLLNLFRETLILNTLNMFTFKLRMDYRFGLP